MQEEVVIEEKPLSSKNNLDDSVVDFDTDSDDEDEV